MVQNIQGPANQQNQCFLSIFISIYTHTYMRFSKDIRKVKHMFPYSRRRPTNPRNHNEMGSQTLQEPANRQNHDIISIKTLQGSANQQNQCFLSIYIYIYMYIHMSIYTYIYICLYIYGPKHYRDQQTSKIMT